MVFELIATIVAGFAGAGVALLLNKIFGGRLPRWIMPVAAGAAMLATTRRHWHKVLLLNMYSKERNHNSDRLSAALFTDYQW